MEGEGFERMLATGGRPEERGYNVRYIVMAETAAAKAHTLTDDGTKTLCTKREFWTKFGVVVDQRPLHLNKYSIYDII
jgi:hypothetical protein